MIMVTRIFFSGLGMSLLLQNLEAMLCAIRIDCIKDIKTGMLVGQLQGVDTTGEATTLGNETAISGVDGIALDLGAVIRTEGRNGCRVTCNGNVEPAGHCVAITIGNGQGNIIERATISGSLYGKLRAILSECQG